jgi:hypothetical protein
MISLSAQRWQSEQVSHVHLKQDTQVDRVRNVAARRRVVHLVGMGHDPEEWLQRHAGREGDAVVHLVLMRSVRRGFTSTRLTARPSVSLDRGANNEASPIANELTPLVFISATHRAIPQDSFAGTAFNHPRDHVVVTLAAAACA